MKATPTLTIDIVPARAIELQHAMPQLIERVNAMFGYSAVARVKMVQRPPEKRLSNFTNLRPLSPVEERDLVELTAIVPEGELRVSLQPVFAAYGRTPQSLAVRRAVAGAGVFDVAASPVASIGFALGLET